MLPAIMPQLFAVPSAPAVSASDGTYADKVHVSVSTITAKDAVYRVYRNTKDACRGAEDGCLMIHEGGSTYDDTSVTVDTVYYYWGQRCSDIMGGCSSLSASDTGYAHLPIPKSTDITASDGTYTDMIELSITPSDYATSYTIYRSIKNSLPTSSYATTSSTSYNDKVTGSTTAGTTYYYWVKACNAGGCSAASPSDSGYALAAPSAISVSASDGTYTDKVVLNITPSSGATSYRIYRSQTGTIPAGSMASTASTTFNDTGVTAGITYYYWVKACNSAGCSAVSTYNTGYAEKTVTVPASTRIDASDGIYTDKVSLLIDQIDNAVSYMIYRATSNSLPSSVYRTVTTTQYDDTAVTAGTTYYYWVKACNSAGCSSASASDSGYAKVAVTIPDVPQSVEASDGDDPDRVTVAFNAVEGAQEYELYRRKNSSDTPQMIGTVTASPFEDNSVQAGVNYLYAVKACNSAGCSAMSTFDVGYTPMVKSPHLRPPETVEATNEEYEDKVVVTFSAEANATSYKIYRSALPAVDEGAYIGSTDTLSWEDNDTREGSLNYWVKACDATGCSGFSMMAVGAFKQVDLSGVGVDPHDARFRDGVWVMVWSLDSRVDHYVVYRATEEDISQAVRVGNVIDREGHSPDYEYGTYGYYIYNDYYGRHISFKDYYDFKARNYYYWIKACNHSESNCKLGPSTRLGLSWHSMCKNIDTYNKYTPQIVEPYVDVRISNKRIGSSSCRQLGYTKANIYRSSVPRFEEADLMATLPRETKSWKDSSLVLPNDNTYYYWAEFCNEDDCSDPVATTFYAKENIYNSVESNKTAMLVIVEGGTDPQREGELGKLWDAMSELQKRGLFADEIESFNDFMDRLIDGFLYELDTLSGSSDEITAPRNQLRDMLVLALSRIDAFTGDKASELLAELEEKYGNELEEVMSHYPDLPDSCRSVFETLKAEGLPRSIDTESFLDTYGEEWLGRCLVDIARPHYNKVVLLTDEDASSSQIKSTLTDLHMQGYRIDIVYDNHGFGSDMTYSLNNKNSKSGDFGICFYNGSSDQDCKSIEDVYDSLVPVETNEIDGTEYKRKYNIGSVYSVSCWGSGMNDVWTKLGAQEADGSYQTNYFVLVSPIIYLYELVHEEKPSKMAAEIAYETEKDVFYGSNSNIVGVDFRPILNSVLPVSNIAPIPCGIEIGGVWFGLNERTDKRGQTDYCDGSVMSIPYDFEKICPLFYTKIYQHGADYCQLDIVGPRRDTAHWEYDLNQVRANIIDQAFGMGYGYDKSRPVKVRESSKRIHKTAPAVHQNTIIHEPTRIEADAEFIHMTPPDKDNKFQRSFTGVPR